MSGAGTEVLLEHHLKELKLAGFVRDYRKVSQECAREGSDYAGFLLRLAERELLDRERRASERRVREST